MKLRLQAVAALAVVGLMSSTAWPLSQEDVARLGHDLTPVGAEKAGNKDGTIPAWSGKADEPLSGWTFGKVRSQYSKLKDEKPLFSIDASNVDKYADKLTPGQVAVLKQVRGYRIDVYTSHRDCAVPADAAEITKDNATEAKLGPDGYTLVHAKAGGVPFPIPRTGAEVMWNQKLRISGLGFEFANGGSTLGPRRGSDDFVFYDWSLAQYFPWGRKNAGNVEDNGGVELYSFYKYSNPPALVGQAIVSTSYLNKATDNFYYFPGQRRVRRLPAYAYDAPLIGFENEYMVEIQNMFWSPLDRFDYKIVGKKEIYVPYNAFHMYDFNAKRLDAYKKDFVNPDF